MNSRLCNLDEIYELTIHHIHSISSKKIPEQFLKILRGTTPLFLFLDPIFKKFWGKFGEITESSNNILNNVILKPHESISASGCISYRTMVKNGYRRLYLAFFLYLVIPLSFIHRFNVGSDILSRPYAFITSTFSLIVFEQSYSSPIC